MKFVSREALWTIVLISSGKKIFFKCAHQQKLHAPVHLYIKFDCFKAQWSMLKFVLWHFFNI